MAHCSTAALGYAAKFTCPITATTCFSGTRRGWGFRVLSCAAKAAFVSRRGEGARMGGVDAPPSARRLVLRSASREGGSLKPGGGKSPPDRQRRSFAAPGFVVARSAAPSTKNFEEPKNSQSPLFTCNCQIPSLTTDNYSLLLITCFRAGYSLGASPTLIRKNLCRRRFRVRTPPSRRKPLRLKQPETSRFR